MLPYVSSPQRRSLTSNLLSRAQRPAGADRRLAGRSSRLWMYSLMCTRRQDLGLQGRRDRVLANSVERWLRHGGRAIRAVRLGSKGSCSTWPHIGGRVSLWGGALRILARHEVQEIPASSRSTYYAALRAGGSALARELNLGMVGCMPSSEEGQNDPQAGQRRDAHRHDQQGLKRHGAISILPVNAQLVPHVVLE